MTTFALNNLWAYLQGLSLSQNDREWLANKLIMPKETNLVEDDNARLDEALAKFSGDFGGSADAMTVAEELRQGADRGSWGRFWSLFEVSVLHIVLNSPWSNIQIFNVKNDQ